MTFDTNSLIVFSWTIQGAMALILLCAMAGVVVSFNRPAMRSLTMGWAAFTVLTFADLGGTAALASDPNSRWLAPVSAVVLACVVMIAPWWMHAADVLAGARREAWPTARRLAPWIAGAGLAALGVMAGLVTGKAAFYYGQPTFYVLVSLWAAAHAWRRSRGGSENPLLLRLLAFAIALMPVRIALTWLFRTGVELREQSVAQLTPIVVGQVLQALATGVIIIVVALGEERGAVIAQEERLRDAEARLLDARRFESLGRLASGVAQALLLRDDGAPFLTERDDDDDAARGERLQHLTDDDGG